ncbi:adenylyl-sulfate kinase [Persicobacter psychrovividus]|uniref:Adenylyl-sulfate kinase n=1 Tax=Persicobacter psychrovividus TaxID=387638 RepID=A0ABN6LEX7_9BACT|nr:adenylyl-sulfate kinase [Persicobacter psychrovividus]
MSDNHIYPIFDTILQPKDKEQLLGQTAKVFWMVGLSGSGKSTLARALENALFEKGFKTMLLDGDNLRTGINNNLGFSQEDRTENIRRAAEVSKLFASSGLVTICSLISPTEKIRKMAKEIIGQDTFEEVFIECPIEVCEQRDVKGLYAKARKGEIKDFTGISSPFEAPTDADIVVNTAAHELNESLDLLVNYVLGKIQPAPNK